MSRPFRRRAPPQPVALRAAALVLALATPAAAALLPGDLNGDGSVDGLDEAVLAGLHGSRAGSGPFDSAGDLNADGRIDVLDLALFGASYGITGGPVDHDPPELVATLNDIPGDMNDRLVVPPDGFQVTLLLDSAGGSAIDVDSLSVTSSRDVGAIPAGSELAPLFSVTPTRAVWEVPPGSDLAHTAHQLSVRVRDRAGNEAADELDFEVRDFPAGPPLESLQTVFLDFDADRSGDPEIDFLEDLRALGLASDRTATARALEPALRDRAVAEILARVHPFYGRRTDGSPGVDAARVVFTATPPATPHTRLCVGGESPAGPATLGAAPLDVQNLVVHSDECTGLPELGIFPRALVGLWGGSEGFRNVFGPLDPGAGVPAGEDPMDPLVLAPGFDPAGAGGSERARHRALEEALAALAQAIATVIAHETGHLLGLTAPGEPPAGLWGGTSGEWLDHNVEPDGGRPAGDFLMNAGGSFTFDELTGRGGRSPPRFRPLSWAYLRDRIVLDPPAAGPLPAAEPFRGRSGEGAAPADVAGTPPEPGPDPDADALAGAPASLQAWPPEQSVIAGQVFHLELALEIPAPLRAYDLSVAFDADRVELLAATPVAGFDDDGRFLVRQLAGPALRLADLRHGPAAPAGIPWLAALRFRALAPGTIEIAVDAELADARGARVRVDRAVAAVTLLP